MEKENSSAFNVDAISGFCVSTAWESDIPENENVFLKTSATFQRLSKKMDEIK